MAMFPRFSKEREKVFDSFSLSGRMITINYKVMSDDVLLQDCSVTFCASTAVFLRRKNIEKESEFFYVFHLDRESISFNLPREVYEELIDRLT